MDTLNYDLPGISRVGLDLIALLNDADASIKQIAAQAKLDPVIYGHIVAQANSAAYSSVVKSTDITTLLVRLGQRELKRIVYQVVLRSAFFHESSAINAVLRRIWLQSLTANIFLEKTVAAAPEAFGLDMEALELLGCLGLVHNIGYLVLLVNFQHRFLDFFMHNEDLGLQEFFREEHVWFDDFDHFSAGRAVLEHWNFPRSLWEIVGQYNLPSEQFQGCYPVLHNLLRLARHMIMMTEHNFHPQNPADYWLSGTVVPEVEIDFDAILADVLETVSTIEATFA